MVCENRRLRSLLVSRRGGFLEDPFFRDAWGDYHNAVRRIVDRFNHGMFAPRDRLRDSHYDSMYRTLRSARINLAAQSARFKDEGSYYKLVMDVREFLGGEVTVRTAGGTVSVRGRFESGAGDDAATTHSGSSRASSARTLHRRFNLPPDADGEKVASTLSRDAVLTVTIPKRTDVRVIPVTVEKDGSTASGRSGTKRHSGTHYDQGPTPNKRTQDHRPQNHTHASHRSPETPYEETRDTFRMGGSQEDLRNYNDRLNRRDREGAATGTKDRDVRRNSDLFNRSGGGAGGGGGLADEKEVRRRSYPEGSLWRGGERVVNSQENKENCTRNGRGRDITEEELEDNPSGQRSRRRAQKYEEAKEFNIPIRIEETGGSDIIFQYPAASNTEPENTPKANVLLNTNSDSSYKNTDQLKSNARFSHQPSSHQTKEEKSQPRPLSSTVPDQVSMASPKDISNIRSNLAEEKENIKPAKDEPAWVYSDLHSRGNQNDLTRTNVPNVSAPDSEKENKQYSSGDKSTDNTRQGLEIRVESPGGTRVGQEKKIKESKAPEEDKSGKLSSSNVTPDKVQNSAIKSQTEKPEGTKDYLRNVSQESASPDDRSKSPVGGREVMVEKKQSDMEGDMFNDCWQNFSSTLHEVLARLQELSAELGHGRPSTTPSSSPPTGEDISADTTPEIKPIKQNQQAKHIINSQVPNKESQQREINEYHVPVTIEGSEWVAGGRGSAAVGVGGRTPTSTTSTTTTAASRVHEGERSATRSGTTNQPNIESSSYKLSEAGLGSSIERDSPESQSDLRASDTVTSVPWRGSSGGRSGSNGGALARDNVKTASLVPDDTEHKTSSVRQHVPMSFIDGVVDRASQVSDSRGDDGQRYAEHLSPGARRRPSSLNIAQEGSLLKNLRKSSPVDALKDKFLSHVTPTSECSVSDKDVYYVPVELEARKTVVSAANDTGGPKNTTPASRPVASTAAAAAIPLCERRGKGIDNLVIIDPDHDHQYSNSSDSASTTASDATSEVSSSVDFGDVDADSGRRKLHLGRRQQQNNNSADAVGNSRVLNAAAVGPAQFQEQESSSDGGGAALRGSYPLDAIVSGSVSGGSWPKPRPRTPSSHQSDSDPDVDELISHAERVIEETKRLSASITNETPFENNLDKEKKEALKRKPVILSKLKGFNLAPNIDTRGTSPDSNFVEVEDEEDDDDDKGEEKEEVRKQREGEEEVIVKGCLSIPLPEAATSSTTTTTTTTSRPRKPRHKSPPESPPSPPPFLADTHYTNAAKPATRSDSLLIEEVDDDSDDVIASEELRPTIVTSPEIQSSDVMGCEREGGRGSRSEVPLGGPREARPRTLAHEAQPNRAPRRGSSRERMGSVFSRGRSEDSTRQRPLSPSGGVSGKPKVASPTQQTPSTPSTPLRANSRLKSPSEERQVPPYVKQKPEPTRRYSGFAHVQSDNVRKMRDVWGSKQEPPPQPPQRGNRVPASPPPVSRRAPDSPGGSRRAPDSPGFRNTPDSPSLRRAVPDPPGYRRATDSPGYRRAPDSPGYRRAPDSPSYRRAPDSPSYRKAPDSPGYRRAPDSPGYRRAPDSPGPRRGSDSSGPRRAPDSPATRRGSDSTGPRRAPDSPCPRRVQDPPVPKRSTDSPTSRTAPDLSGLRQGPDSPRRSSFSRDTKSPSRTNNYHNSTFSSRSRSSSSPCRGSSNSGTEGGATTTKPSRTKDATSRNAAPAAANSARSAADKFRAGGSPGPRASPTRRTSTPPPPSSRSTPPASPFHHKLFRRLRDASLQPDSETICFTEEEDRYKLVMDVEEYVPGEIEVLQDDKLLTVKGRVQTTSHGNTTTRTFSRNFDIPHNTREEDIDSALSKDGILTVYVPKKRERVIKIELTD